MKAETIKLEQSESRGGEARDTVKTCSEKIEAVLRETGKGDKIEADAFIAKTLPNFLAMVKEDGDVLKEMTQTLLTFANRSFQNNEEVEALPEDSDPLTVLNLLIRL